MLSWKHPLGGMHSSWLLFEGVAVFMHMFVFVWSSLILVLLAIGIRRYLGNNGRAANGEHRACVPRQHFECDVWRHGIAEQQRRLLSHMGGLCAAVPLGFEGPPDGRAAVGIGSLGRYTTICPLSQIVLWEAISFMAATIIRMIWTYANPPFGALMRNMVVNVYGSVLILHCLYLFILIGLFSCWFILAAVVRPEQYSSLRHGGHCSLCDDAVSWF